LKQLAIKRKSEAAFLGHFADNDPYEPAPAVSALEERLNADHRPTIFFTYPGSGNGSLKPIARMLIILKQRSWPGIELSTFYASSW
jgi:dienelactone hydrolase